MRITDDAGSGHGQREAVWHAEGNVGVCQFGSLQNGEHFTLYHWQLQTIRTTNLGLNRDGGEESETLFSLLQALPGSLFFLLSRPSLDGRRLDEDGMEVSDPDHNERASDRMLVFMGRPLVMYCI